MGIKAGVGGNSVSDIESSGGPTRYYHLCKTKLGVGSIIEPGNYGDLVRLGGYKHNAFHREALLEETRQGYAPAAPSRLNCVFVFPSERDARTFQFREFQSFGSDYLYEVEPITDAMAYTSQIDAIENWNDGGLNVQHIQAAKALAYWRQNQGAVNAAVALSTSMGELAGFQEILLGCAVRVVGRLTRIIA